MVPVGIPGEGCVDVIVPESVMEEPKDIDPDDTPAERVEVLRKKAIRL